MKNLIGVGITLPGIYDQSTDTVISTRIAELANIKIKEITEGALGVAIAFIEEDIKSAALSNINTVNGDEGGILSYVYIGNETVNAVTIDDGKIIYGANKNAGDIKNMLIEGTKSFESVLEKTSGLTAFIRATSVVLFNLSLALDPAKIIIECEKFKLDNNALEAIKNAMSEYAPAHPLPELLLSEGNIKHSHRGIAIKLREKWLEKIIK